MRSDGAESANGFTLVEVISAGFVLGVFVFFALPIMNEMRIHHSSHTFQLEIGAAMQRKMEEIQHVDPEQCHGEQKVKSQKAEGKDFLLRWNCKKVQPFLYELELEAEWKGFDGKRMKKRWITHRFQS